MHFIYNMLEGIEAFLGIRVSFYPAWDIACLNRGNYTVIRLIYSITQIMRDMGTELLKNQHKNAESRNFWKLIILLEKTFEITVDNC